MEEGVVMGWANSLILVGLGFALTIGVVLYVEARRQNEVIKYHKVNQPGCFMVGKDCK
jgi:hypothetical protein